MGHENVKMVFNVDNTGMEEINGDRL